jgi:hypothetical protein
MLKKELKLRFVDAVVVKGAKAVRKKCHAIKRISNPSAMPHSVSAIRLTTAILFLYRFTRFQHGDAGARLDEKSQACGSALS